MAIGLITTFKIIPWSDVLTAAPYIVQGAEKLWGIITRKTTRQRSDDQAEGKASTRSESWPVLDSRVHSIELLTGELHKEVLLSSELIKSLAQQNARLVQAVEILRVRTRVLFGICGVLGVATATCAYLILSR